MSETQKTISGRHFINETVVMDGRSLDACILRGCRLVYRGGEPPKIHACQFDACRWEFEGAAAQTLLFLTGLYHGGFESAVENTFAAVRGQSLPTAPVQEPERHVSDFDRRLAEFPPVRIIKRPKPKTD